MYIIASCFNDVSNITSITNYFYVPLCIDSASDVNQQLVSNPNVEKKAVEHILTLIRKHVAPVLKSVLKQPELNQNEFRTEYGSLGPHLFSAIQKLKTTNPPNATNQPVKTESGTTSVSTPATLRQAQIPSGTLPQQPLGKKCAINKLGLVLS